MFNRYYEKITAEFTLNIGPNRPIIGYCIPVYDYTAEVFANTLKFINEQVQSAYANRSDQDLILRVSMDKAFFGLDNIYTWNLFYEEVPDYINGNITALELEQKCKQRVYFYDSNNIKNLDTAITKLYELGEKISKTDQSRGGEAISLAQTLKCDVQSFIGNYSNVPPTRKQLAKFKELFSDDLHSKDREMSVHRNLWTPLIANVALALTVVGIAAIAVNLIWSKITTGQFSFFYYKTSRESARDEIENEALKCGLTEPFNMM